MLRDRSLIPLSQQHHNGLALCVLVERSLAADAGVDNVARLASQAVERYDVELVNHFEIEEQVLFPALRPSPLAQLVDVLVEEHREFERLAGQLRSAPSVELLQRFVALLRTHIRKEENELFERAQALLPRETLDALGEVIDRRAVRICLTLEP